MSIQALADAVGIAKGAVYREFASKDDLLDVLLVHANERLAASVRALVGPEPYPRLSTAYRAWATALLDEPLLCAAYLDDGGVLGAQVGRRKDGRYRQRHDQVRAWIRELQRTGRVRAEIDPDGLALALSSATLGLLTAAATIGPIHRSELVAALEALEAMTRALET